jgi:hypothetical protein
LESPYFNAILHFVAQDERYNKEMAVAKEEFERFAGPIFETDRSFDARINSFHNWYILDRPLASRGITPLRYFLDYNANSLPPHELKGYQELEQNLHSVFELVRSTEDGTRVRDLLSGKRYEVAGEEVTRFIDKGALFSTRLFKHDERYYFSNYVLLHPAQVTRQIKGETKKLRKARGDPKGFLFQLVLFQSRWDQYKQMDVKNIYRFGA